MIDNDNEWHKGQWVQFRRDPLDAWKVGEVSDIMESPVRLMVNPDDLGTTQTIILNLHEWQIAPLLDASFRATFLTWADELEDTSWYDATLARKVAKASLADPSASDALGQLQTKYPGKLTGLATRANCDVLYRL